MSFSHDVIEKWTDGARTIEKVTVKTGNAQTSLSEDVPDSSTDLEIAFVLDVSEVKAIYIVSDQDLTLETNNGGSPVDTLSLVADEPVVWHSTSLHSNPFSTDITALFATNASGSAAVLQIEVLYDPTP